MTFDDHTALHEAAMQGDFERVRELLAEGADPDWCTLDGLTPLTLACRAYPSAHMGGAYASAEKAGDYMACALELADGDRDLVMSIVRYLSQADDCL